MNYLKSDGLLTLDAQAVFAVGEIDALLGADLLHMPHTAIKIGINCNHPSAMAQRLHQLRRSDFSARQKHQATQTRRRAVSTKRRRGVASRGTRHGGNIYAISS